MIPIDFFWCLWHEPSIFHGRIVLTCFSTVLSLVEILRPESTTSAILVPSATTKSWSSIGTWRTSKRILGCRTDFCVFFLVGWDTKKNLFRGKWGQRVSKMQKPSFLWYDSCFCGNILVVWCFHFSLDFSIAGSREGLYWPRLQVGQLHHRRTGQGDHRSTLQQWAEPTQDVEGLALRFALSMWLKDVKVGEWFNDVSARALQMPNGPNQFFFFGTMLDCCIYGSTIDSYSSSQLKWCSSVPALPCGKLSTSQEFPGMLPIRAPWHYFVRSVSNNLWIASPFHYNMTFVEALQFRGSHDGKRICDIIDNSLPKFLVHAF